MLGMVREMAGASLCWSGLELEVHKRESSMTTALKRKHAAVAFHSSTNNYKHVSTTLFHLALALSLPQCPPSDIPVQVVRVLDK